MKRMRAVAASVAGSLTAVAALLTISAAPAGAVPAGWLTAPGGANSNGAGFCVSQVAQDPEGTAGTSSFGELVRATATSGAGAVPDELNGVRYPLCGGPGAVE
jgi:hypothetical protein